MPANQRQLLFPVGGSYFERLLKKFADWVRTRPVSRERSARSAIVAGPALCGEEGLRQPRLRGKESGGPWAGEPDSSIENLATIAP